MIGIIGAMEEEVRSIQESMANVSEQQIAGMNFYEGLLAGKECVVVCSGIGKVNAAACAQILCDRYKVDKLINTGVAGGLEDAVEIGDIVLSTDAVQHDMDCVGFGYKKGVIPRMATSEFKADEEMIEIAERCCKEVNPGVGVFRGRVASGDVFVSSAAKKAEIRASVGGYCCEMEGAAIAQVAYLNNVPFLIIRAISDKASGEACDQYDEFEEAAIGHFYRLTMAMIAEL